MLNENKVEIIMDSHGIGRVFVNDHELQVTALEFHASVNNINILKLELPATEVKISSRRTICWANEDDNRRFMARSGTLAIWNCEYA